MVFGSPGLRSGFTGSDVENKKNKRRKIKSKKRKARNLGIFRVRVFWENLGFSKIV